MTDNTTWTQRPEAERLLERLTHLRRGDGDLAPEAQTVLLEIIARMALSLDDRAAQTETHMATAAQGVVATMRAALPIFREMLTALSDPPGGPEPPETDTDTGQPGSLAELVRETYGNAGVTRIHVGPSGSPRFVEPHERVDARPHLLVPGDVVARLYEYPRGHDSRLYLGHMSHPLLPDLETLLWWNDRGVVITPRVDRMQQIGIILPSTDEERLVRLKRWTEAMD